MRTTFWLSVAVVAGAHGCFDPTLDGPPLGYEADDISCFDGRDNDRDGFIDCADIDCVAASLCGEIVIDGLRPVKAENTLDMCRDGIDNDLDGQFDCGDRDCQGLRETCCLVEVSDVLCSDGKDNDGNGFPDCEDNQCTGGFVRVCRDPEDRCFDGRDNDDDGLADCEDPNCADQCPEGGDDANCSDGKDNDADGLKDCDDPGCARVEACQSPEDTLAKCKDGIDNDGNGFIDCEDFDCSMSSDAEIVDHCENLPTETTLAACSDGKDNDNNGYVDCEDFSCTKEGDAAAMEYCANIPSEDSMEECNDNLDNDNDGYVDCGDFSCSESMDPEVKAFCAEKAENTYAKCKDGIDNDGNGFIDCNDRACNAGEDEINAELIEFITPDGETVTKRAWPCQEMTTSAADCTDGIDNDGDGFTDCQDWDCSWAPNLFPGARDADWSGPADPDQHPCINPESLRPLVCG